MVRRRSNSSIDVSFAVGGCPRMEDPWSVHSAGIKERLPSGKIRTQ
jgi:hypothetical protein